MADLSAPTTHQALTTMLLYSAYQQQFNGSSPLRLLAQHLSALWMLQPGPEGSLARRAAAACEVLSRLRLTHQRPLYGIDAVTVEGAAVPVTEDVVLQRPFGNLLRFRRADASVERPRVLLVAPLSGHFATLLRETIRTLVQHHDVHVTDWRNARDIALSHGSFAVDDYVDYLMQFIRATGTQPHVVAVCQPCVAALAATALMAEDEDPHTPRTLTLMAGPVDCRVNPTEVNRLATGRSIHWFDHMLISHVPAPHAGFMRRVYPGFVQLGAFMSMNLERHRQQFVKLYHHLVQGERAEADAICNFYDEYLAVNDLPAEFYLETVKRVFQTFDLARGDFTWRGRRVDPGAIRRTALLTVEGERDDICSVGQTVAAHDLCASIRPYMKTHHVQVGVGHYGVFSGRRWNDQIYPRVRELIHDYNG